MTAWIALNSTVRFLIEPCALLALMYWGIHTGDSMAEGIVIGALAPGAAIFVWWKLIAPKSASWLTDTGRFLVVNGSVRSVGSVTATSARYSWDTSRKHETCLGKRTCPPDQHHDGRIVEAQPMPPPRRLAWRRAVTPTAWLAIDYEGQRGSCP